MQSPLHVSVCVQNEPLGQESPPTTQVIEGSDVLSPGGGLVAMQAPPQAPVAGQVMVGVHVAPVGQGLLSPTVQGTCGGGVTRVKQRPPQVWVWVQVEPVGQGSPERMHVERGGGG
jgi:hypothetical protein